MESAITIKGQATIPKAIRDHLGLKPGDRVKFFVHPDGSVVLLPKLPASALRGIVPARRGVTIREMDEAIAAGATRATARGRRRALLRNDPRQHDRPREQRPHCERDEEPRARRGRCHGRCRRARNMPGDPENALDRDARDVGCNGL